MKIKNREILPLIGANAEVVNNVKLKQSLPKALLNILSAQKNIKTLENKYKAMDEEMMILKRAAANKDEKGNPAIIDDPKNPKNKVFDIPDDKMEELKDAINLVQEQEIECSLSVFSEETSEIISKYLTGEQTMVFLEYLMEKTDEKVEAPKLEPVQG